MLLEQHQPSFPVSKRRVGELPYSESCFGEVGCCDLPVLGELARDDGELAEELPFFLDERNDVLVDGLDEEG